MNVIIVGYGQMGHEVEGALLTSGHKVAARVDPSGSGDFRELEEMEGVRADAAIEFSLPGGVVKNTRFYAEEHIPAVVGTTGWEGDMDEVRSIIQKKSGSMIHGSNFSIGAHLFFRLCTDMAGLIDNLEEYDLSLLERHHRFKKDSPSGTALTAARKIINASTRKRKITTERLDRAINDDELHVASVRGGSAPGCHILTADSAADTIEVTHTARNRSGFARGAIRAADWLIGRRGLYDVDDFIADLFQTEESGEVL